MPLSPWRCNLACLNYLQSSLSSQCSTAFVFRMRWWEKVEKTNFWPYGYPKPATANCLYCRIFTWRRKLCWPSLTDISPHAHSVLSITPLQMCSDPIQTCRIWVQEVPSEAIPQFPSLRILSLLSFTCVFYCPEGEAGPISTRTSLCL